MSAPYMDVLYVSHSNSSEMTQTLGEFLTAELQRLGMDKTELAARLKVKYPTVLRWTKDRGGFTRANRSAAAQAMGLAADHFERPDLAARHEANCKAALEAFLASPLATQVSDAERASIAAFKPPIGQDPTPLFYAGALNLVRGLIPSESFADELAENEALARSVVEKLEKQRRNTESAEPPKVLNARKKPRKPTKSRR